MGPSEFTIRLAVLNISYLTTAILFVIGLKLLSKPETARAGNRWAAGGMILAIIATLLLHRDAHGDSIHPGNVILILIIASIGTVAGWVIARKVKMTAMPQMVSFYNATGGIASGLVALTEYSDPLNPSKLVTLLGITLGMVAFSGSLVAYGKLVGKISDWTSSAMKYINLFMLLLVGMVIVISFLPSTSPKAGQILAYFLFAVAIVYGILFVMPIGGADMPVVISLLNSLTGVAAAMAGFIYDNQAMILGGILVGAAGTILTILMCKAMNRSLINVIIGAFGKEGPESMKSNLGEIRKITVNDTAILLNYSQKVIVIPGYGMASAQAQYICSELDKELTANGVDVRYAIHPVAGRMPGHMNVLLAEANIPYEKLVEMDEINPDMANVDVAVIIGANDVVNPAAMDDPSSPIYGMPIILAHKAKNIIVIKRGMGKGYAAIENHLFYNEKTRMLFGNAKEVLQKLVAEIKNM
jgi:H+-translocating NAD(P) transhydrogenase subunit beta